MANTFISFCLAKYWNGAAPIITNYRGSFSNWFAFDVANNGANDEATDEALNCFCGMIYLSGGFSAFLLTHQ